MGEGALMQMRILRLTPHFYYTPDVAAKWVVRMDQIGGMQTQIYRQSLALAKRNIYQEILPIAMASVPKKWEPRKGISVIQGNIPMIPIKSKIRGTVGLNFYWGIGIFVHLLKYKIKGVKFDLIHTHCSGVATPLIIGIIAKKILKVPLVYTVHCCRISTYHPMSKIDGILNGTIIKIEKKCLQRADKIITLTNRTKTIIEKEYKIDTNHINVIPDIIDCKEFIKNLNAKNLNDFKMRYKIPTTKKRIAFIGRIAYEKGCFILLDAFAKLKKKDCKLIFFGDGNERNLLTKKIKKYGLEKQCQITGYLPNEEIPFAIATADFIVMPSLHEEFGGLLLEIAAVGKAVIASDAGSIPSIVHDGQTGLLFRAGDVDMLAKKMEDALQSEETLLRYGKELQKEIYSRFSFNSNVDAVCDIYKKLKEDNYVSY